MRIQKRLEPLSKIRQRALLWRVSGGALVLSLSLAGGPLLAASSAPRHPDRSHGRAGGKTHSVELRGDWFYVDGEPFLVKGIGYSPYRPGQTPWKDRVDPALMERDFQRISEAGFNTIRTWSPLSPEALALADRYGLMVLQGVWIERNSNYASPAFHEALLQLARREAERSRESSNILALLVGNELLPQGVYHAGEQPIEALLKSVAQEVKRADPGRFVSYANWPPLDFIDHSMWDLVCFNVYPYEPASVSHTFGFRSYIRHLKQTVAKEKPLVITETGLSVSPKPSDRPGYGGLSPEAQRSGLVRLWDDLFQSGAQGGVIFEWNDEWWKHASGGGDARLHEENNPEAWFGLIEFTSPDDQEGTPRPAYEALKTYNQAILLTPVSDRPYQHEIPVAVYATASVSRLRVQLDDEKWLDATQLDRHWWKLMVRTASREREETHRLTIEAWDASRQVVARQERSILLGPQRSSVTLSISTDRVAFETSDSVDRFNYTITVTDELGRPLAGRPVQWAASEPLSYADLIQQSTTDAKGRVEGTYLVYEPGLVRLSASTPVDPAHPHHRIGAQALVTVHRMKRLSHQPSRWEAGAPEPLRQALRRHEKTAFQLANAGDEEVVDYERYGAFIDEGKSTYRYEVKDWALLAAAVGEGVYPNEAGLLNDPAYQAAKQSGKLEGSHWDFIWLDDVQLGFFKWASTDEEVGVKQFYTALMLERAGLLQQAVKAYYAILAHFPRSIGWTAFDPPTPWYVGKVARDHIESILRLHPELGLRLEGAEVVVQKGFDNDVDNDVFLVSPGRLVGAAADRLHSPSLSPLSPASKKRELGQSRVRLAQYQGGHWQLLVDGKPWEVRGITYKPTAVGETPDEGTVKDWVLADRNGNGVLDVLETFADANHNGRQDPEEPSVGDFQLLHAMGANTLRLYHTDNDVRHAKALLRQLYEKYGFMVMMGDFVGMYTVGSGAKWEEGTNYLDKTQRKRMLESVKEMVQNYKDEPYLLMWVLGNENNYGGVHGIVGGVGNAGQYPQEYYSFINELASWIHSVDPDHPVAIGNGEILFLDLIAQHAPAIDIFGANVYRGWHGFGRSFFEEVKRWLDKPVLITEFGCPAYQIGQTREVAESGQAVYHFGSWVDLADNMAGRGVGNAIGAVVFEWSDEWWKAGQPPKFSPYVHETHPNWPGPFPGGWNFEEWFGLVGQGDGGKSPYLRQPRLSYELYRQFWKSAAEKP